VKLFLSVHYYKLGYVNLYIFFSTYLGRAGQRGLHLVNRQGKSRKSVHFEAEINRNAEVTHGDDFWEYVWELWGK